MSYRITLIKTSSPSNKINKNISNLVDTPIINLKSRPKDINNLDIDLVNYQTTQLTSINYAYIQALNLYYFVKIQPSNIGNGHNILHLELDPLMTYKSQILGLKCITERNTNNYNAYLTDDQQKITSMSKQFYHTFRNGDISHFKPHSSILVTLVGSE